MIMPAMNREVGTHAFAGVCAPDEEDAACWETFSVGVFEWVPTAGGTGVKRGKVKVRVRGEVGRAEQVYAKAQEIIALLDAGIYTGPESVTV